MSPITELSDNIIKKLKQIIPLLKKQVDYQNQIKQVKKIILLLRKAIRKDLFENIEHKFKAEGNLSALIYYLNFFKNQIKSGKGLQSQSRLKKQIYWEYLDSAFNNRIITGIIVNNKIKNIDLFFKKAYRSFAIKIRKALTISIIKVNAVLYANFIQPTTFEQDLKHFTTANEVIDMETNLKKWFYLNIVNKLSAKLEDFQDRDSGWSLLEIAGLKININKYSPLGGGTFVELPKFIQNKKAVVNIKNDDEYCFLYCILASMYPQFKKPLVSKLKPFLTNLNFKNINFPIKLKDIKKFEKLNNLSINVYSIENNFVVPIVLSKHRTQNFINLLAISSKDSFHFTLIKNLSRLVSNQISNHNGKKYICHRCINSFSRQDLLDKHLEICFEITECKTILPKPGENILTFKQYHCKQIVPFVVYADLECILEPCDSDLNKNSINVHKHVPFSVAYYVKCSYENSLSTFKSYRGKNCIQWFVAELKKLAMQLKNIPEKKIDPLSNFEKDCFNNATHCHICEEPFKPNEEKVRDHFHLASGCNDINDKKTNYRGPAHSLCNLNFKKIQNIPVAFHNLSGYDSHFLIKELLHQYDGYLSVIPSTKEKYISFSKFVREANVYLKFIDSFRFLPESLDTLTSQLEESQKIITRDNCKNENEFILLSKKGVFPYEYLDSWEKLNENKLPEKKHFFSSLNDSNITDSEYETALNVWDTFNIKNLGEYSDLYLKTDVLLLADIFENFRKISLKTYKLDPANFVSAPSFSFQAMLKTIDYKLELLTDIDMCMLIEKGIRGGVAQCSKRYSKANNKYMKNFDPSLPKKYITYFDVNNMYGAAMSHYLPYADFKWTDPHEIDLTKLPENNSDIGYIFELDIEYPKNLHNLHKDLPFLAEHRIPTNSRSKQKKLLLTLYDKNKYVIHYTLLKQAIAHGLVVKKIHRVLQFKQAPWLEKYISLNTELRKKAVFKSEQDFYKLLINAIFGKCLENVRKHRIIKIVNNSRSANKYISKANFHNVVIIDENTILIELKKNEVTINKPIYAGISILDISKTYLYDFHYNFIKKEIPNDANLLYTDTDSLIYEFINTDVYDIIKKFPQKFDTSGYPKDNVFGIQQLNKKQLGIMKDECCGKIIFEFVALRAKMYSYKVESQSINIKKIKGVRKPVIRKITFDDFLECLNNSTQQIESQYLISSKNHQVFTTRQKKVVLSSNDDKRIIQEDGINTLPWGFSLQ